MENSTELIMSEDLHNNSMLEATFSNASSKIKHEYLNCLTKYPIVPLQKVMPKDIADKKKCTRDFTCLFEITKLVYNKDESFLEKLTTIARAASIGNVSLVTIITSEVYNNKDTNVSLFMGTVNKSYDSTMTNTTGDILKNGILGSFCGSDIEKRKTTGEKAGKKSVED